MFFRPNETAICVCCVLWASEEEEFVRLVSPVFSGYWVNIERRT